MRDLLITGLNSLGVQPRETLCDDLLGYMDLLQKWNKVYNLTAIDDPTEILNRHIFDSLSVLSYINGPMCLDIGTGAGLPGLILAMTQPQNKWTLLDSNQKKVRFIRHAIIELGIDNIEVVHSRVESYKPQQQYQTLICRAFAPIPRLLDLAGHLLTNNNQLLAMKGKQINEELKHLSKDDFLLVEKQLQISDEKNKARLIQISRAGTDI